MKLKLVSTLTVGSVISEYSWLDKDYRALVKFERKITSVMMKLNNLAADVADGSPISFTGPKVDMVWSCAAYKDDGKLYARQTNEWPGMEDTMAAAVKGIISGEISDVEHDAKKMKSRK